MVERGLFREDLYYRLSVFPIFVPPLVKRKTDILLLANYFMQKYATINEKPISGFVPEAIDLLLRHRWPGNVRELENCIERAVLLADGEVIEPHVLPMTVQAPVSTEDRLGTDHRRIEEVGKHSLDEVVGSYEKAILAEALAKCDNNVAAVARLLSSTPRIIGYKIKQHQLL
jgi:Nif-specific regulatory protein